MAGRYKALLFDAYGTLFDTRSLVRLCEEAFPGRGERLCDLWRARQLQYTWLRTLMGRYADFWQVTREALAYACQALGLDCPPPVQERLMQGYLYLDPFPDTRPALEGLAPRAELVVLSNGTEAMLHTLLRNTGLEPLFRGVVSVERVRAYKPDPRVYRAGLDALNAAPEQVLFVSSNGWDIAGAASAGLPTCWVNRHGAPPEALGLAPLTTVASLSALLALA